jgi:hypothetical protein
MRILGLVFAGTPTPHRIHMARSFTDSLQLPRVPVAGVEADRFALPDGPTDACRAGCFANQAGAEAMAFGTPQSYRAVEPAR